MSNVDELVERDADRLAQASERAAGRGGVASTPAEPLAEDVAFLQKLKPSLIKARIRGDQGANGTASSARDEVDRSALPDEQRTRSGGPNPFLVAALALAAGVALAKLIDWRSHAYPRG
jgi:hypothetical protein